MSPAHESLNPDDALGDGIDLTLVHDVELLALDGDAEVVSQLVVFGRLPGHGGIVESDRALPRGLGGSKRCIGAAHLCVVDLHL